MSDRIDALDDLRRQFAVAAERESAKAPRRRRRRRLAITLAGLLSVGAVAEAVNLVSTGEPVAPVPSEGLTRGVPALGGTLDVTAKVKGEELPFGVVVYRRKGEPCATGGQVRGNELGEDVDGSFRSYEGRRSGACGDLKSHPLFLDLQDVGGYTLVLGRAAPDVTGVEVRVGEDVARPRTGSRGAFLAVFKGRLAPRDVGIQPLRDR